MRQRRSSIIRWGAWLLFVPATTEVASYTMARIRLGIGYRSMAPAKAEFLALVPWPEDVAPEPKERLPLNVTREIHPFFGFSYERDSGTGATNNQGFVSDFDFPYRPATDELVVGIFGGSVALDLRRDGAEEALRTGLERALEPRGYRKATILPFAQGGWREPQSAFCFLYFADQVDVAMFLEGLNEVGQLPVADSETARGYPWFFPDRGILARLTKRLQGDDKLVLQRIADVRRSQIRITRMAGGRFLGRSMAVHLAWRMAISFLQHRVDRLDASLSDRTAKPFGRLAPADATFEQLQRQFFERYEHLIEVCHEAGRLRRVPVFHFLQPSLYDEGSKPLTAREREILARAELRARVPYYYPLLREMSGRLRARGVPSFDLTMLFRDDDSTVYSDSFGHLKPAGMKAVAEAMVRDAVASPDMGLLPEASSRPRLAGTGGAPSAPREVVRTHRAPLVVAAPPKATPDDGAGRDDRSPGGSP